ncbi:unnamed protein product [Ixodes pacificus]
MSVQHRQWELRKKAPKPETKQSINIFQSSFRTTCKASPHLSQEHRAKAASNFETRFRRTSMRAFNVWRGQRPIREAALSSSWPFSRGKTERAAVCDGTKTAATNAERKFVCFLHRSCGDVRTMPSSDWL